jgi:hypothetical protein
MAKPRPSGVSGTWSFTSKWILGQPDSVVTNDWAAALESNTLASLDTTVLAFRGKANLPNIGMVLKLFLFIKNRTKMTSSEAAENVINETEKLWRMANFKTQVHWYIKKRLL